MKNSGALDPNAIYQKLPDNRNPVQLFISPSQYIQGRGVINLLGEYLSLCISGCAGVLITPGRDRVLGNIVYKTNIVSRNLRSKSKGHIHYQSLFQPFMFTRHRSISSQTLAPVRATSCSAIPSQYFLSLLKSAVLFPGFV